MQSLVFDRVIHEDTEDSGAAVILEVDCPTDPYMFVRLQSYDTTLEHSRMTQLQRALRSGRTVRVTVEIL